MKTKNILPVIIISLIIVLFTSNGYTQPPPPPGSSGGDTPNGSNDIPGQNAPIGSGLFILLGLGAVYGRRKIHQINKDQKE